MTSTGTFSLGDVSITAAGTTTGTPVTGLAGVSSVTAQLRFEYGSGGTNARAYIQTSLDQGSTWVDIACMLFTTVSDTAIFNFTSDTPQLFSGSPPVPVVPTDGALADDSAIDGVLGDRFRLKVVSTGTYATQTLIAARITVR